MISNINITPIRTWSEIPVKWDARPKTAHYNTLPWEDHYLDGWRHVVRPVAGVDYNPETQYKGAIYFDSPNDVFTYPIINKTDEEIRQELINLMEAKKQEIKENAIREIEEKALKDIQLKEGSEALAIKLAYPLWDTITKADLNSKYTFIETDKTITLYKCILAHTVDGSRPPATSPLYFTKVTESVIAWVAGINAIKGRLYSFNGKFYRCQEDHLTVAGQDPTKAKQYWIEEKL